MADTRGAHIKICGVRDAEAALAAIDAGATAIGFILAPSRRRVDPIAIREILAAVPQARPLTVGVTVNEPAAAISRIVAEAGIDMIQLSGDEEPSILGELPYRKWKSLRFPPRSHPDAARREIDPWFNHSQPVVAVHLDASVPGSYGGSGHLADWDLAAMLAREYPVILAGGLTPENVATAIDVVRPLGVDVSSGVESNGSKDPDRIRAFVAAAKEAFASTQRS